MILNGKEISATRIGTCGGIGLTPGTVVVTEQALDGRLQPYLETVTLPIPDIFESIISQIILGNVVSREAKLDLDLAEKLVEAGKGAGSFETVLGKTISTNDFYEGQVKEVLKTLPKAQRTRGLSSSYQSNLMGHITSSNTNLDQISSS